MSRAQSVLGASHWGKAVRKERVGGVGAGQGVTQINQQNVRDLQGCAVEWEFVQGSWSAGAVQEITFEWQDLDNPGWNAMTAEGRITWTDRGNKITSFLVAEWPSAADEVRISIDRQVADSAWGGIIISVFSHQQPIDRSSGDNDGDGDDVLIVHPRS